MKIFYIGFLVKFEVVLYVNCIPSLKNSENGLFMKDLGNLFLQSFLKEEFLCII